MKHEARSTRLRQDFGGQAKSETSTKQKILNFVSLEFRVLNLFRISNFEFRIL